MPLGFFGGIGAASRQGVLVKGSNYLEVMSEMKTIVFDKTGTLTKGEFTVSKLYPNGVGEKELLEIAALAEGYSAHPVAGALKAAYKKELEMERVTDTQEIPGHGIKATVDGATVYAGNAKLMEKEGIWFEENHDIGTVVYLAKEDLYLGSIVISDTVKPEAKNAIKELKENGVTKTVMLTGDRKAVGEAVAKELGIDQVYTDLLPGDKVDKVEALLEEAGAADLDSSGTESMTLRYLHALISELRWEAWAPTLPLKLPTLF